MPPTKGSLAAWTVSLALLLGCGPQAPSETGKAAQGSAAGGPAERSSMGLQVSVRNSCPEAVVLAVSAELPSPATPTVRVGSTRVQTLQVPNGHRVWLRVAGEWDESRSVAPHPEPGRSNSIGGTALFVRKQCNVLQNQRER